MALQDRYDSPSEYVIALVRPLLHKYLSPVCAIMQVIVAIRTSNRSELQRGRGDGANLLLGLRCRKPLLWLHLGHVRVCGAGRYGKVIIVLDTNIFQRNFLMRSSGFVVLLDYLSKTESRVVIPKVVFEELKANY